MTIDRLLTTNVAEGRPGRSKKRIEKTIQRKSRAPSIHQWHFRLHLPVDVCIAPPTVYLYVSPERIGRKSTENPPGSSIIILEDPRSIPPVWESFPHPLPPPPAHPMVSIDFQQSLCGSNQILMPWWSENQWILQLSPKESLMERVSWNGECLMNSLQSVGQSLRRSVSKNLPPSSRSSHLDVFRLALSCFVL